MVAFDKEESLDAAEERDELRLSGVQSSSTTFPDIRLLDTRLPVMVGEFDWLIFNSFEDRLNGSMSCSNWNRGEEGAEVVGGMSLGSNWREQPSI